jgi:hypothetical protein
MSGTGLSRVRTELRLLPPQPISQRRLALRAADNAIMWVLGRGRGRRAGAGRKANHLKRLVIRPADLPMVSPEEFLEAIAVSWPHQIACIIK